MSSSPAYLAIKAAADTLIAEYVDANPKSAAAFEAAKADPGWERVAQQRIWQIRPPETEEEKLKRAFFGGDETSSESN